MNIVIHWPRMVTSSWKMKHCYCKTIAFSFPPPFIQVCEIKASYCFNTFKPILKYVKEELTSVVILIHSLEPAYVIVCVRNQMYVQLAGNNRMATLQNTLYFVVQVLMVGNTSTSFLWMMKFSVTSLSNPQMLSCQHKPERLDTY